MPARSLLPVAPPPDAPADVAPILAAAGRYLVEFQEKFRDLVAEESYRQWGGPEVVTLRSDVVFVTLPGGVPWVTFRDVYEVNGQAVRDRESRLEALFSKRQWGDCAIADSVSYSGYARSGGMNATGRGTLHCDDGTVLEVEEALHGRLPEPPTSVG